MGVGHGRREGDGLSNSLVMFYCTREQSYESVSERRFGSRKVVRVYFNIRDTIEHVC